MIVNVEDLRKAAKRRLPKALFDYVDRGAEDEYTLRANRAGFHHHTFSPRVLVDVSERDLSTTVLGEQLAAPLILAPTGFTGVLARGGEILAARAAAAKGVPFTLSTMSICSIEEVATAVRSGTRWFQLYVWKDREITKSLIERARAAGYTALVLTVDTPVLGMREADYYNGLTIPPRVTVANALDLLQRPAWILDVLLGGKITFGNFVDTPGVSQDPVAIATFTQKQFSPAVTWQDLDWFRSIWGGPMAIKGILSAEDARIAVDHGVEAIIVSNHGGRQGDYFPGAVEVLPEIVDAVAGRAEIILDGGVRRGTDVIKAIALGAKACMIGRAFNYGVAARGQAGVEKALDILIDDMSRTLALIGRPKLSDLDRSVLRPATARRSD